MRNKYLNCIIIFFTFFVSQEILYAQAPGGINANLRLWLKADAGVITNGSTVTTWQDQSGGGFNAVQNTVSKQPSFTASSEFFNGNPALNFDLADDAMTTTASITSRPYSFFVVYNSTSTTVTPRRAVQGSNNWLMGPYNNISRFYAGAFVDLGDRAIGTKATINTGVSTAAAANNATFYFDGRIASVGARVTATGAPGIINLGGAGAYPAQTMGGSIAEVIAYNTNLTTPEKYRVESYLAIKYGVTLNPEVPTNKLDFFE